MSQHPRLEEVYALLARRDLASAMRGCRLAQQSLDGQDDDVRLALQEGITHALHVFLGDLAEHGAQNRALWGDEQQVDVKTLVDQCVAAWEDVQRLRAAGVTSQALTAPYAVGWLDPIGSPAWLERMERGIPRRQDPKWITRVQRGLQRPV